MDNLGQFLTEITCTCAAISGCSREDRSRQRRTQSHERRMGAICGIQAHYACETASSHHRRRGTVILAANIVWGAVWSIREVAEKSCRCGKPGEGRHELLDLPRNSDLRS